MKQRFSKQAVLFCLSFFSVLFQTASGNAETTELIQRHLVDPATPDGYHSSATVDKNGRLAISYIDVHSVALKLWVDDGRGGGISDDHIANGTEVRIIVPYIGVPNGTTIINSGDGYLAIAYRHNGVSLWHDDGRGGGIAGDGLANGSEIRIVDPVGGISDLPMAINSDGQFVLSIGGSQLKVWVDNGAGGGTARDGIVNGSEIRVSGPNPVISTHRLAIDHDGRIAVSYVDSVSNPDLRLWYDDGAGGGIAGDGYANGGEIRTIDSVGDVGFSNSIAFDANNHLAVSYREHVVGASKLKFWLDDGAGGGTAGNATADGAEIRVVDTSNTGFYTTTLLDADNHLTVSYADFNGGGKVWQDNGSGSGGIADDGVANGDEIRNIGASVQAMTIDGHGRINIASAGSEGYSVITIESYEPRTIDTTGGQFSSITVDSNRHLAISHYDSLGRNLRLWIDDGAGDGIAGNGLVEGDEKRIIDSPGFVGQFCSMTLDHNNHLAISYYDQTSADLKVWIDDGIGSGGVAGDGNENGDEKRTIDPTGNVGTYTSITNDTHGHLAVSYVDSSNSALKVWVDDGAGGGTPDDGEANGSELRTILTTVGGLQDTSIALDTDGHLSVSYNDLDTASLRLWVDDGAGGGTADDLINNGSEDRSIDASGNTGLSNSLGLDPAGFLSISYNDIGTGSLKIWRDDGAGGGAAGDNNATAGEIRTIDGSGDVGYATHLTFDPFGRTVVSYWNLNDDSPMLWVDDGFLGGTPDDHIATTGELRSLDATNTGGNYTSVKFDASGRLAMSYFKSSSSDLILVTFVPYGLINVYANGSGIANGDTPSVVNDTDFGTQSVASGSVTHTITVQNYGESQLYLGKRAVSISGTNASDFSVSLQPDERVGASSLSDFNITFNPTAPGARTAIVTVRNNDPVLSSFSFEIAGFGLAPEMNVSGNGMSIVSGDSSPSPLDNSDFGSTISGNTISKSFTIENSGDDVLNLNGSPRVSVTGSAAFAVSAQPSSSVGVSSSTTFSVLFAPTSPGVSSATLSIANDDPNESPYTFSIQGTANVDTDGDETADISDPDDDNDGVSDTQEAADGTNSVDRGSYIQVLPTTFCSEWNGYLGMYNINEYYNAASSLRNLSLTLFDSDGNARSATGTSVLAGSQSDVLVHDLPGFTQDRYGRICTEVAAGAAGDIDGRTMFYHPRGSGFDFAFALPFFEGRTGSQYVQFNTFDPSLFSSNPADNWITVINDEALTAGGTLTYFAQDGSTLGSNTFTLPSGGRRDFAAQQFGINKVGLVEWIPNSGTTRFVVRNIRYYYDNPLGISSFHSAIALEGSAGNGEPEVLVLDKRQGTAVLELSNATNTGITIDANFRTDAGALVGNTSYTLPAHTTFHAIADEFMPTDVGSVTLDGSVASSVVATTIHYSRDAALNLKNAYALHPRESKGASLRGSYNSFLGQTCDLILTNTTSGSVNSTISLKRYDGVTVATGIQVSTPGNGVSVYNLCALDPVNSYGLVSVVPNAPNSITGTVLRKGANGSYQLATQLRQ